MTGLHDLVELRVRCIVCKDAPTFAEDAPAYLVSGLIIAFHANHEGHQLEIIANGRTYCPGNRAMRG
jgi:hypothetical protein